MSLLWAAVLERPVRVEQDRHGGVGVVPEPDRDPERRVEPEVFPGSPERLEADDPFWVAPPLGAPGALAAVDVSPPGGGEELSDELLEVGVVQLRFRPRRPRRGVRAIGVVGVDVVGSDRAVLARLAGEQRMTVPRLLVESALSPVGETPTQRRDALAELFAVRRLRAAVSNNVNQVARHANAGEEFPQEAAAVLAAVRRTVGRIDATLEKVAAS